MEKKTPTILSIQTVKAEAIRLGFSACGISPAEPIDNQSANYFTKWLTKGKQADMHYLENYLEKRLNPTLLIENAQTIVSVALNYFPSTLIPQEEYQMAWYAYGRDYHNVVKEKLNKLLQSLQKKYKVSGRCFCDTAPILEKYWAWKGGLGWIGKNTQLILPQAGSTFFLGELILNLPTDQYDSPLSNHCGACNRCITACPTCALHEKNGLDARKCLSYLSIENKGEIPKWASQKMYPYFYGCDRCLQVCPHTKFAIPTNEPSFAISNELLSMTKADWNQLSIESYRKLFKESAVKRAKFEGLTRNIQSMQKHIVNKTNDSENKD